MANPTTNFGWQMPTATDLVTDLPADFEVFGQAVDTDFVGLKGGTTGQVLAKASGTDLDFVWSADAAGMTNPMTTTGDVIYSSSGSTPARLGIGTDGQVLTSDGSIVNWETPSADIPLSTVTTNGDVIYATGSGAVTRLGIGSTDDVLTVAGGVPTWAAPAGGADTWTLLNAGGTSLTSTAVNITGISGQNELMVLVYNCSVTTGSQYPINITFNADGSNHARFLGYQDAPSTYASSNTGSSGFLSSGNIPIANTGGNASSVQNGYVHLMGANSTGPKPFTFAGGATSGGNNGQRNNTGGGVYLGASTISEVRISMADTFDGGTIYVYGRA